PEGSFAQGGLRQTVTQGNPSEVSSDTVTIAACGSPCLPLRAHSHNSLSDRAIPIGRCWRSAAGILAWLGTGRVVVGHRPDDPAREVSAACEDLGEDPGDPGFPLDHRWP